MLCIFYFMLYDRYDTFMSTELGEEFRWLGKGGKKITGFQSEAPTGVAFNNPSD